MKITKGFLEPAGTIDFDQACLVATAFLDAPRLSSEDIVTSAYASLGAQADAWFHRLTRADSALPIRVVYTASPEPYASGTELARRVRCEGVLEIRPAWYDRDRRHPVLDMSEGGTYDRFRAVHDIVSHAGLGFEFDRQGEFAAWLAEDRMYSGSARWALATELHGEHSVRWTTGEVAEHKAVLLDPDVMRRSLLLGTRRLDLAES